MQSLFISIVQVLMVDVVSFERESMVACMLKLCACVFVFSCLELQSYFVD